MEQVTHILTLLSAAAAGSLVSATWKGLILAIGVALCLRWVSGTTAAVRSILWTGVLLLVVLLHFVPFFARSSAEMPGRIVHVDPRWGLAIACAWGILSLVRGAQLVQSAFSLRRIARGATSVKPTAACAAVLGTSFRSAKLCTSPDVDRPSVIGFFRPRVLLPQALFEQLSASELEQVVMHEMEHLRRADDWMNLLQKISLVLFPLNPVLLWVEHRLCVERELACDDHVLRLTRARKAYATCLVNLAEHSVLRRGASLVLGAWERQSELGRRVRRILQQPEGAMGHRQLRIVTGALGLGLLGGAMALAHEPQIVSFTALPPSHAEASLQPSSGYVPVSFRNASESPASESPKMIKTVFQEPGTATAAGPKKPHRRKSPRPSLTTTPSLLDTSRLYAPQRHAQQPRSQQQGTWIVLTDWTDSPLPSRLRLVVSDDTHSYAAVQMMNGWLIVQL